MKFMKHMMMSKKKTMKWNFFLYIYSSNNLRTKVRFFLFNFFFWSQFSFSRFFFWKQLFLLNEMTKQNTMKFLFVVVVVIEIPSDPIVSIKWAWEKKIYKWRRLILIYHSCFCFVLFFSFLLSKSLILFCRKYRKFQEQK